MTTAMRVCTIIARNYLAYARTLAASLAEHHPRSHCSVLVVDDPDRSVDAGAEQFEVVWPDAGGVWREPPARSSASWRLTAPLRAAKNKLLEGG